jgi:hypothetical protein
MIILLLFSSVIFFLSGCAGAQLVKDKENCGLVLKYTEKKALLENDNSSAKGGGCAACSH